MDKPYAKFIGFQEDPKIGGYRAYYVIYAEGFERDLSTVFAGILRELNIPIPPTPEYVDAQKTERWLHKCDTCQIAYFDAKHCVTHKYRHTDHNLFSVKVPVIDQKPPEQSESKIYIKDVKTGELVEESELKNRLEQCKKIDKTKPSEFIKKLRQKYKFLNKNTYEGEPI